MEAFLLLAVHTLEFRSSIIAVLLPLASRQAKEYMENTTPTCIKVNDTGS